ncbi:hypothetical protein [Falsarthrobacter nasiphocae]|uniref:Uncharacterized protein n=1 Tax=Falsarthrobacter nasiphocae TaxID=189863 RepID=A0AAE4C6F3_9MICC|nr:hypothetical protein [Falsarthrobacter nasiphocae]MDR6891429.1 hypothetical protein [Falsarthrobacter nasiphocae]
MTEAPLVVLHGDVPGATRLEAARWSIGETAESGRVPVPDPREEKPWLLLRTVSLLADAFVDLQPYGARLQSRPTRLSEQEAAEFRQDLEAFAVAAALEGAEGLTASLTICGPVTLASRLHTHAGESLLSDRGAARFVAESLAEGVARLAGRLTADHGIGLELLLVEDRLEDAADGRVRTASRFATYRALGPSGVRELWQPWAAAGQSRPGARDLLAGVESAATAAEALAAGGLAGVVPATGAPWSPRALEAWAPLVEAGSLVLPALSVRSGRAGLRSAARDLIAAADAVGLAEDARGRLGVALGEGLRAQGAEASGIVAELRRSGEALRGGAERPRH